MKVGEEEAHAVLGTIVQGVNDELKLAVFDFFLRIQQTKSQWIKITFSRKKKSQKRDKHVLSSRGLTVNVNTKDDSGVLTWHWRGCLRVLVSIPISQLLIQLKEKSDQIVDLSFRRYFVWCTWLIGFDDELWRASRWQRKISESTLSSGKWMNKRTTKLTFLWFEPWHAI